MSTVRTNGAAVTLILLSIVANPAGAQEFTMAVDVPSQLDGTYYLANQTLLRADWGYALKFDGPATGLDPAVNVNAITGLDDASFLFSADVPFSAGGSTYLAGDVVRYSAVGGYSLFESAGNLGLPEGANIDALAVDANGDLIFSLDAPASMRGTIYMPADLILFSGGLPSMYLDGSSIGFPDEADVVGFDEDAGGSSFFMFDAPLTIAPTTYLPGDIVEYDGLSFSLYFRDAGFPSWSMGTDFYFPGAAGAVEDLIVTERNGDRITIEWSPSCSPDGHDYAVYEGAIGAWYTHDINQCSTNGNTTTTITVTQPDRYFLVVPLNANNEGSYGLDSTGTQRPLGQSTCAPQQNPGTCP